jgi:sulfur-oxidizing protein SoxX
MRLTAFTAAAILAAGATFAETLVAPDDVQFTEYGEVSAALTSMPGDAARGLEIFTNRGKGNCVACHTVAQLPDVPFHGEVGPELTWTGEARSVEELRGIVVNSKMMFEGTVMPAFYKTSGFIRPGNAYTGKAAPADLPPILTAQEVEDVVAYLLTLKES